MAIPIQCPECHKRYQAPDHMAGRRVKCKYCGVVFLIAADSRTENPDFDLAQLDELAALGETGRHEPAKRGGTTAGATAVGQKTGVSGAGGAGVVAGATAGGGAGVPAAAGQDIDDIFRGDFVESGARRTNKLYIFPMSRLLDRWLPPVLLAIGIVWVCREGWARNNTGQPWVGAFRAGVFLLAFFASIFPFTRMGVYAAARRLRYELPPRDNLRVLGTFAVPAALAAALWLIYQDVTGLLLGCLIGAVVAMPVLFLLFRLLPREAPVTFAYAAGTFFLSIFVSAAALFALNLMLVGILRSTKTEHALASSPFGPGFRWEQPYHEKNGRMVLANPDGAPDASAEDPAAPTTHSAEGGAADGAAGQHHGKEAAGATTREGRTTGPALVQNTGPSTPTVPPEATGQGPARVGPGGSPGASPGVSPGETARTDAPPSFIPDVGPGTSGPAKSGIVKDVRTVFQGDGITAVVRPLVTGPWLAVVRPGARGTDRLERWNTDTWKQAGEAVAARDPDGNIYSISPDGELLAYITDFPSLSIQVYSFAEGKVVREIRLKTNPREDWGQPRLLGFSRPDQLVVHWRRGEMTSGIEVHTLKGNSAPRHFSVEDFDASPGTYAVSPDGQSLSLLWRRGDTGGIASYALGTSKPVRSFPIDVLDWRLQVRPAGLAFSPDGSSIAAVIEGEGQGLFAAWPAAGKPTRPLYKHVVPIGNGPDAFSNGSGNGFEGQAFEWLDEGRAFVLYGSSVFDTGSGQFLGDVGIEGVRAQMARGKNVCDLVRMNDAGRVQVDVVTLDLSKARDSAGAAGAPPQRPQGTKAATRRAAGAGSDTR